MARAIKEPLGGFAHNPAKRGYCVAYRENQINHCPGGGGSH
jgi:hypothetical protein